LSERIFAKRMLLPLTVSISVKSGAFVPKGSILDSVNAMFLLLLWFNIPKIQKIREEKRFFIKFARLNVLIR